MVTETSSYPTIQVRDVTIIKKAGTTIIKRDLGSYGYLELRPEVMA